MVRRFVTRHPDAVVLDLGAGQDGRMFRVNPPPTVDWYDIDFPEILVVRRQVLPQRTDAHDVGSKLNRRAQALMRCQSRIVVIPGATHLFEEPGTLERAADACAWFTDHLAPTPQPMA